jgi:hypothetical protein
MMTVASYSDDSTKLRTRLSPLRDGTLTGTDTNGPDKSGERVGIIEASRRLGITTDAVRKRIHRGILAGEREGGRW